MNPSQQNSSTDQTANFFWLLILLTIGVIVFWWLERSYIVAFIFSVRYYEIELIKLVIRGINVLARCVHLPTISTVKLINSQHFMATVDKAKVTFPQVTFISDQVGAWFRYPIMLGLSGLAAFMFFHNKSSRFCRTYSMQTLKKTEVENWPQITPVISLNLLKEDIEKGPWAMAEAPLDFCKKHDLLVVEKTEEGPAVWKVKPGEAEQLFVLQMGPLWGGVQALPIHVKALLVIFVGRANKDKKVVDNLLAQIALSAAHGKLDFSGVEESLRKYQDSKLITWLAGRHAYVATLMASMLQIARSDGVLATSEFLWLKPVDRRLWFALNSVGRQTAVVEVSGIFAHWLAEKKLRRPLKTPMVREAVVALEAAVKEILYTADEEKWHTSHAA